MTEESAKTYVFDSARGSMDPSTLLALMNGGNGGFGGGNWMWIIFLFFLYGWGGNGLFGGRGTAGGLGAEINGDYGRSLLLQAINGNGTAISQLASTLNCDVNAIQSAINSVQQSVASVGTQVGMTGAQVTSAINAGNQALSSQLAQCCCDNKLLITTQGYENRIATAEQTAFLGAKIDNQTNIITDKFCDLEKRELQNKIDSLREQNSTLMGQISNANQTAAIQSYVSSLVTPIAQDVASLKACQPPTINVPYPNVAAVPTIPNTYCNVYGPFGFGGFAGGQWA